MTFTAASVGMVRALCMSSATGFKSQRAHSESGPGRNREARLPGNDCSHSTRRNRQTDTPILPLPDWINFPYYSKEVTIHCIPLCLSVCVCMRECMGTLVCACVQRSEEILCAVPQVLFICGGIGSLTGLELHQVG